MLPVPARREGGTQQNQFRVHSTGVSQHLGRLGGRGGVMKTGSSCITTAVGYLPGRLGRMRGGPEPVAKQHALRTEECGRGSYSLRNTCSSDGLQCTVIQSSNKCCLLSNCTVRIAQYPTAVIFNQF